MKSVLLVGIGGFLGSMLRWALSIWMMQFSSFLPWGTLTVNLGGCFIIGILFGLSSQVGGPLTADWRLFLATGFCGSFTTFSTFSLENIQLFQQGQYPAAFSYMAISLVAGLALTGAGIFLARSF